MSQLCCEVNNVPDVRRWRREERIFELAVRRMTDWLPFSMNGVTDPLWRSTNNPAITEVELKL
jgi:hypothetical protein